MNPSELPQRIGPYRILGLLGEGATGRVYRAEQTEPQRVVALKVLKSAGLSGDAQQRFRREAELLAQLEHPGIARLYAAGVADGEAGPLPYLAMEYVRGVDLLAYARQHGLDVRAKLALLARICQAVHYAHSRGIVHRDLKPANILVDDGGEPRILDFGVARVAEQPASMTMAGEVLGTVPYMSPEQLAGGARSSDPRSDVYSLGVIAYELLSGELPYPGLSTSTVIEAIVLIRSGRIEPLSRREPRARGDAETVVMKAMAHEAARRYGSAAELAGDLERFLRHQPIEAHPPGAAYVLGLFVRRHRALSVVAALALLALVGGIVVSNVYALSEAHARREAEQRLAERNAVNEFLRTMLTAADPDEAKGAALSALDIADAAYANLEARKDLMAPAVAISLNQTLAQTYAQLSRVDRAETLYARARELAIAHFAAGAPDRFQADFLYAKHIGQYRNRPRDAAEILKPYADSLPRAAGEADRPRVQARAWYATSIAHDGRAHEARPLLAQARDEAAQELGADDDIVISILGFEVYAASEDQDREAAVTLARQLVERTRAHYGAQHTETMTALARLVTALANDEQREESMQISAQLIELMRTRLGADNPNVAMQEAEYAKNLANVGRAAEAVPILEHAIPIIAAAAGPTHHRALGARNALALALMQSGDSTRAEAELRAALAAFEAKPATGSQFMNYRLRGSLARLLYKSGRYDEAGALLQRSVAEIPQQLGDQDRELPIDQDLYAQVLIAQQRWDQALALLELARPGLIRVFGEDSDEVRLNAQNLGRARSRPGG